MQVDLDDYVPEEMYRAIAEILAWVYELENRQ
jgi:flagellar biosynthesis protein